MSPTRAPARQQSARSASGEAEDRRARRRCAARGLPLGIVLQAVNAAGDGLAMVALANRVFQTSHASWAVAAVFLAVTVPISALAPVAGLLLDRLPVKTVLVIGRRGRVRRSPSPWCWRPALTATLILATGFGICAAVLQPGLGAIVPRLAARTMVIKANSYLQAATWIGFTAGPLLAGLLITRQRLGSRARGQRGPVRARQPRAWRRCGWPQSRRRPAAGATGDRRRPTLGGQLRAGYSYLRADVDAGMLVLIVGIMVAFANMAVVAEVVFAEQRPALRAGRLLPAGGRLDGGHGGRHAGGGRLRPRWLIVGALAGTVLTGVGVTLAGAGRRTLAGRRRLRGSAAWPTASRPWRPGASSATGLPTEVAGRVFAVYSGVLFGGISVGMAVAAWPADRSRRPRPAVRLRNRRHRAPGWPAA